MIKCKYQLAWIGPCNNDSDNEICAVHQVKKCWKCGEQAVMECNFAGQFVCGTPSCKEHDHYYKH